MNLVRFSQNVFTSNVQKLTDHSAIVAIRNKITPITIFVKSATTNPVRFSDLPNLRLHHQRLLPSSIYKNAYSLTRRDILTGKVAYLPKIVYGDLYL